MPKFSTLPGTYCKYQNLDIAFGAAETLKVSQTDNTTGSGTELIDNLCEVKCHNRVHDTFAHPGDLSSNDWCSGNNAEFDRSTLALCLPRERCEDLCDRVYSCHTFFER